MFYIERTHSRDSTILRSKRLIRMETSGTAKEGKHSIQHIFQYVYKDNTTFNIYIGRTRCRDSPQLKSLARRTRF
jgi:hypothetical protein